MTKRAAATAGLALLALLIMLTGGRWVLHQVGVPLAQQEPLPGSIAEPGPVWVFPDPSSAAKPGATVPAGPAPTPTTPTGESPTASPTASTAPSGEPSASPTKSPSSVPVGPLGTVRMNGTKKVTLTFDDGPHPAWTPKVLNELSRAGVKAIFCVVGTQAKQHPELVARIVREGHVLCNHTWHHEFELGELPEKKIRENLERTNQAIEKAVPGVPIKYFRHPGGKWTPAAIKVARELGMVSLHWDVDPQDWNKPSASTIRNRVLKNSRPGSIVLLHDGGGDREATVAACPDIIAELKRKYGIGLLK